MELQHPRPGTGLSMRKLGLLFFWASALLLLLLALFVLLLFRDLPMAETQAKVYLGVIALLIVAMGGTFALMHRTLQRRVVRPMLHLAGEIRNMQGEAARVHMQSGPGQEVAELAAAFNQMMANLQAAHGEARIHQTRLEAVLANFPGGLLVVSEEDRVELVNDAFWTLFGLTRPPEEWRGCASEDILAWMLPCFEDPEARGRETRALLLANQPDLDRELHLKGGRVVLQDYLPIEVGGVNKGWIWSHREITGVKETEAHLREATAAAQAANRAKSEFLANMSHEIRTPMNAIVGLSHLALKTELDAKQQDYLTKIQASGRTLLALLNDILDLSKIEAGKLDLERAPFRLELVLDSIAAILSVRAREKDLDLRFAVAPEVPLGLVGDSLRLGQVLLNLVTNAVKFTAQGFVEVRVAAVAADPGRFRLEFSVRDSGMGMTPDQVGELFQPFTQADTSTTRRFGGTGLGLAIARRLVGLMGGDIGVESAPGQGSVFRFSLELEAADQVPQSAFPLLGPRPLGGRVLLVEDNDINRQVATELLTAFGYEVEIAENGLEAVQATAGPEAFDAVLMDIQMPIMDGLEATTRILRNHPELPIIAMTAHALVSARAESQAYGMVDYLTKPIDPEALERTLARWVRRQAPPAAPAPEEPGPPAAVAGLDWVAALKRLRGNTRLLVSLLENLRDSLPGFLEALAAARKALDGPKLRDLAHQLVGMAGNVSAGPVLRAASALETAARAEAPILLDSLGLALEERIQALQAGLAALPGACGAAPGPTFRTPTPAERDALAALILELDSLLRRKSLSARRRLGQARELLPGDSRLQAIESRAAKLDFQGARRLLAELAQDFGFPHPAS